MTFKTVNRRIYYYNQEAKARLLILEKFPPGIPMYKLDLETTHNRKFYQFSYKKDMHIINMAEDGTYEIIL